MTKNAIPITIRVAAVLEAANIVRLLKSYWQEQCGLTPERVNDAKAMMYVMNVMNIGHIVVADRAGRLIGVAGCAPGAEEVSDDWFLDLAWLYVVPFNTKVSSGEMPQHEAATLRRETAESLLVEIERFADVRQLPLRSAVFGIDSENHDRIFSSRRYLSMGGVHLRMPSGADDGRSGT
jgi:hypothetical protein